MTTTPLDERAPWGGRAAQALTAATLATYGTTCHLCGLPGANSADHLIPRSKGGPDTLENLRPAHGCDSDRARLPYGQTWEPHNR